MVEIERHPNGPRVRVVNQRVHHGAVGCELVAIGLLIAWHDRHDWRAWFKFGPQRDAVVKQLL